MRRILLGLAVFAIGVTVGRAEQAASNDPTTIAPAESAVQVAIRAMRASVKHATVVNTIAASREPSASDSSDGRLATNVSLASAASLADRVSLANASALMSPASFAMPCARPAPCCPPPCCPPSCCEPCCEPCCPKLKIIYHQRRGCCKVCCGCCEPPPLKTVLSACDPCTGCVTKIPVTLPGCTVGKPAISHETGLFGRAVIWHTWSNGFAIKVMFKKCADEVIVTSYGS